MRKSFSLTAGVAAVALAAAVTVPAHAVTGGTPATAAGPNVVVNAPNLSCSGTLINLWMVLTAWHCFKDGTTGTIQWGDTSRDKGKKISISTVVREDDLAVLYLAEDVPFGEVEYPALGTEDPQVGDAVQFFGFGIDDSGFISPVLRTGSAPVIPAIANGQADVFGGPSWSLKPNGDGSPAPGDSGGGAYLDGKLVGVASNVGARGANYVSVARHLPFLEQQLK